MADKEIETGTTPSIRDSISDAVETVITESTVATPEVKAEVAQSRAERTRDDAGRFAQEAAAAKLKAGQAVAPDPSQLQRPSSWKKDLWGHWDKLVNGQATTKEEALALATYIAQREQDYARGVSTYKSEWDHAKPYLDAMQPILPMLQQSGIDPGQWLQGAANTHMTLVNGGPREKLAAFFKLGQQFQVPLEEVFEQDENGRLYLNPQRIANIQSQNSQPPQQDVRQVVQEMMIEQEATQQVAGFTQQHPEIEQVRETMAGLLRAGLVEDLSSAYEAALYMPQHKDLFDFLQAAQQEEADTDQRAAATKTAQAARVKAVSPRSSTPAGQMKTTKDTGLRSTIEDAFNQRSGRV